jgi:hypothetical protein
VYLPLKGSTQKQIVKKKVIEGEAEDEAAQSREKGKHEK